MKDYRVVERRPTVEEFNRIRQGAGLSRKNPAAAAKGIENSLFCACVMLGDECVGIGRVVGDGGLVFDIVDVAVLPEHQGNGLGKRIMDALMAYVRANAAPTAFISLMTTAKLVKFYEGYGFKVRGPQAPGMYQVCVDEESKIAQDAE
jgi:ribosomal protein S18 acetylase RimI-like enzyme